MAAELCPGGSREKEKELMTMPTLDQTEGIWIGRTSNQGYHYVQAVFPGNTPREQWHQANCRVLIARGHLQPEQGEDRDKAQKVWDPTRRYMRIHT